MSNELVKVFNEKQNSLWEVKASCIKENQKVYFKKALINILSDPKLSQLAATTLGAGAIWKCIVQAMLMGLQIGGSIPQAYILAFGKECTLSPTAEGYKFIALSNPDPVLKSFEIDIFFENDEFQMDKSARTIKHIPYITDKKRRLMGVYCIIEELGGNKRVDYITRGEIEEIRDKWSPQPQGKAWKNSFEMMALAKAAKRFLKPYAALKEGLRMAFDTEDEIKDDKKNIEDRAVNIIDVAMPEPEPEKEPEPEPKNTNVNPGDFF